MILLIARRWNQQVEWAIHAPVALRVGIDAAVVDAIARDCRPAGMSDDEALVYDFTDELDTQRMFPTRRSSAHERDSARTALSTCSA